MPNTRKSTAVGSKKGKTVKAAKRQTVTKQKSKAVESNIQHKDLLEEENAFEHLLSKVNEARRQRGEDEVGQHSGSTPKKAKLSEANNKQPSTSDPKENLESQETAASFEDESMILEMEVMAAADSEFPEEEIQFEDRSVNNNATVGIERSSLSAAGLHGMTLTTQQQLLGLKDVNPDLDLQ